MTENVPNITHQQFPADVHNVQDPLLSNFTSFNLGYIVNMPTIRHHIQVNLKQKAKFACLDNKKERMT